MTTEPTMTVDQAIDIAVAAARVESAKDELVKLGVQADRAGPGVYVNNNAIRVATAFADAQTEYHQAVVAAAEIGEPDDGTT